MKTSSKNRRILIATHDVNDEAICKPILEICKSWGDTTELFYTQYELFGRRILYELPKHIARIPLLGFLGKQVINIARKNLQKRFLQKVQEFGPNLVIVIKGKHIALDSVDAIRSSGIQIVNWFPDGMWNIGTMRRMAPHYSFFFVMDPNSEEELRSTGHPNVSYLPMAAKDSFDSLDINTILAQKTYDVTFVGSLGGHQERVEILSRVTGNGLKIWGPKNWTTSPLRNYYQGEARGDQMIEIYRQSRIVINIHVDDAQTQGPNLRSFEAMAAGALVVSDYKKGLAALFKDGEDIVFYRSPEEIAPLVSRYLESHGDRTRITKNGFVKVHRYHLMSNRVQDILQRCQLT